MSNSKLKELLEGKEGTFKIDKNLLLEHLKENNPNILDGSKISPDQIREKIKNNQVLPPIVIDKDCNIIDGLFRFIAYCEMDEIREIDVKLFSIPILSLNLQKESDIGYNADEGTLTIKTSKEKQQELKEIDQHHINWFTREK